MIPYCEEIDDRVLFFKVKNLMKQRIAYKAFLEAAKNKTTGTTYKSIK